jgi:CheY-like chemotaxis protein
MKKQPRAITILMADDDADDRMLAKDALIESRLVHDLHLVADGQELMDYLNRQGRYEHSSTSPRPGIILLDLNMPRKNGFEALAEIRRDPALRRIPVVILTTSTAEEDIYRGYDLGANSFVSKPATFEGLVEAMRILGQYWFEIVKLPVET